MATAQTIPGGIRISSLTMRRHAFRIIKGVILSALAPTKRGILRNPFFKKHLTIKLLVTPLFLQLKMNVEVVVCYFPNFKVVSDLYVFFLVPNKNY